MHGNKLRSRIACTKKEDTESKADAPNDDKSDGVGEVFKGRRPSREEHQAVCRSGDGWRQCGLRRDAHDYNHPMNQPWNQPPKQGRQWRRGVAIGGVKGARRSLWSVGCLVPCEID